MNGELAPESNGRPELDGHRGAGHRLGALAETKTRTRGGAMGNPFIYSIVRSSRQL